MNPIFASLAAGYTAEEVLNYLGKIFKNVNPKIAEAAAQGYSPDEILKYLQNFNKKDLKKFKSKKEQAQINFQYPTHDENASDMEVALDNWYGPSAKEKQSAKLSRTIQPDSTLQNLAKAGAVAGGGYLLKKALPMAGKFIEPFLQSMGGQEQPQSQPVEAEYEWGQPEAQSPVPQIETASPIQEAAEMRVDPPIEEEIDPAPILENAGIKNKVDELLQAGNGPDQINGYMEAFMSSQQKKAISKMTTEPLSDLISKYVARNQPSVDPIESENIQEPTLDPIQESAIPEPEDTYQKAESILENAENPNAATLQKELKIDHQEAQNLVEKYNDSFVDKMATLPNGEVAEVQSVKDGIAKIKVNGKERLRKVKDLDKEPSELEPIVEDLLNAIPEEQKSAVLAFANYSNQFSFEHGGHKFDIPMMAIQFHSGDLYLYPGVSEDQYKRIVDKATPAKTSGDNTWHAWTAGNASRGAGFYEIKKQLEKEFGKNFIKFKANEGYDYFKIVREAIKQVEKRKKQSKRTD